VIWSIIVYGTCTSLHIGKALQEPRCFFLLFDDMKLQTHSTHKNVNKSVNIKNATSRSPRSIASSVSKIPTKNSDNYLAVALGVCPLLAKWCTVDLQYSYQVEAQ
jgi:hypothetical protein